MEQKYEALFTPWKIRDVEIKNRFVLCPMGGTSLFGWFEKHHLAGLGCVHEAVSFVQWKVVVFMKQEFTFASKSGADELHGICWTPQDGVKAVMQIVHGMAEHIERYDGLAAYLAERGILVVGHSHLGHGKSAKNADVLGYFSEPDGNACVIADIHALRLQTQRRYPEVPYFLLGHSMGSFLVRQYLGLHSEGLAGAVIMGTADMPAPVLKSAKALCRTIAAVKGWRHRSRFVDSMVTGGYEKQMGLGWLSKNEDNWRSRKQDPFCGFCFTLNGFYNMFNGLDRANAREQAGQVPQNLPLFFTAGAEDPVGGNGRGVEAVYRRYLKHGAKAQCKLYPGDRHEILHEDDRVNVFEDIYQWMVK